MFKILNFVFFFFGGGGLELFQLFFWVSQYWLLFFGVGAGGGGWCGAGMPFLAGIF